MTWLLDTNTVIYFFKGMGQVTNNLLACAPKEIAIPSLVVYELEVGLRKSNSPTKRRSQLQTLLDLVHLVPFGQEEAEAAAHIRATLEQSGSPIGPIDTLIAGTALANQCTLVTHNVAEFERIEGLKLKDWY